MQIEYSEYQDHLVRGLAHRMNNILTLFHGYLGLLLNNTKLTGPEREGLERITNGARVATELIDRTHALVRSVGPGEREIDVAILLRMLRPSFDARLGPKTTLLLDVPEHLPIVTADAVRMRTAIVELVRNAIEATFAGGKVNVSCQEIPAPDSDGAREPIPWIMLRVVDDGTGVPERITETLFHPFVTTKKQQESAGLGLTLALTFAQQHGGDICFESRRGETTFEMRIPCRR